MTTPEILAQPTDVLVWRSDNGRTPYYFDSIPDALEFVIAEMDKLKGLTVEAISKNPGAFQAQVHRCRVLVAECERLHEEWETQNPKEQYS